MIHIPTSRVEFTLGKLLVTRAALAAIKNSGDWEWSFIFRHMAGEWDELTEAERKRNKEALTNGSPITSRFTMTNGVRLVVRTEEEPRATTTIMLAQESQTRGGKP